MESLLKWIGRLFGITLETRSAPGDKVLPAAATSVVAPSLPDKPPVVNQAELIPIASNSVETQQTSCSLDFAVALATLIDEIGIASSKNPVSAKHLLFFRSRLVEILSNHEIELIEDTEWNEARQRAVKLIPPDLDLRTAAVGESISCGLMIGNRVLKKQEVILIVAPFRKGDV
jgi:hypothetical protein